MNATPSPIVIRPAHAGDVESLCELLFDHGVNAWNHLPRGPVTAHLHGISDGSAFAVVAEQNGFMLGFVSFDVGDDMARYQPTGRQAEVHGIVHEAVVHRDHVGLGLGTRLLSAAVSCLQELGCREIYVARHDENPGSAGMMRKAGFEVIDVFDDPRRTSGNRKTAISRLICDTSH